MCHPLAGRKVAEIEGSVGFGASRQVNDKAEQCWGDNVNEIAVDAELDSIRAWARGPSFGGNLDDIFNSEALDSRDKLLVVLEESGKKSDRPSMGRAFATQAPRLLPGTLQYC